MSSTLAGFPFTSLMIVYGAQAAPLVPELAIHIIRGVEHDGIGRILTRELELTYRVDSTIVELERSQARILRHVRADSTLTEEGVEFHLGLIEVRQALTLEEAQGHPYQLIG